MSRRSQHRDGGWTLLEVLASCLILGMLLLLVMEALGSAQRSWTNVRRASSHGNTADTALSLIKHHLSKATLMPRIDFAPDGRLEPRSDLHFVAGPAKDLIPGVVDVSGDALFFQHPGNDSGLLDVLQGCGFFVRYGDDALRPALLASAPARRRFQLVLFHLSADGLALPQTFGPAQRSDLHAWFTNPVKDSKNLSVVADNVISMRVRALPSGQSSYDSRRYQWEGLTPEATATRHRLPDSVEIRLVLVDELSWGRLVPDEANALARSLLALLGTRGQASDDDDAGLLTWLEQHHLATQIVATTVPLASSVP